MCLAVVLGAGSVIALSVATAPSAEAARIANVTDTGAATYSQVFTQPNAENVTGSWTVAGNTVKGATGGTTSVLPVRGATEATFAPGLPAGTVVTQLDTSGTGCTTTLNTNAFCAPNGSVTIAFSKPVNNPVLHVVGLGATTSSGGTVQNTYSTYGTVTSVPAGATLGQPQPGSTSLAVANNRFQTSINQPSTACNAAVPAGCGSMVINGTGLTQVTITTGLKVYGVATTLTATNVDQWNAFITLQDQPVPTAAPDTAAVKRNTPVTTAILANDAPGAGGKALVPGSVILSAPGVTGATVSADGKTLTVPNEGTYTANTNGQVVFTPVTAFIGTASPITYRVSDADNSTASSTLTVTVTADPPVPVADAPTTTQGVAVTFDPTVNDNGVDSPINKPSVRLLDPATGQFVTSLTVAGEGTYTVAATGDVTLTPVAAFAGAARPVTYRVANQSGVTATSTITPTVTGVAPRAAADTATTGQNNPVTLSPAGNDRPGIDGGTPIDPASVRLVGANGALVTDLTIPSGRFVVDTSTGVVTFTPARGFTGTTPAVTYQVADTRGLTARSTITVGVSAVTPTASGDTAETRQGTAVTLEVVANDLPGNANTALDPRTVVLSVPANTPGAVLSADRKTLTVPNQGTYTVNATTGAVTFQPVTAFTGPATAVPYTVSDVDGRTATANITVTVTGVPPRTAPDTVVTPQNTPVTVNPAANDAPGIDGGTPVNASSLRLLGADGTAVATLALAGQGTFTVNTTSGAVTFTPAAGFSGRVPDVSYRIADTAGLTSTGLLTVSVTAVRPVANDDRGSTTQAAAVTVPLLTNDAAGNAATPLRPATVRLSAVGANTPSADGRTLTVAGQGTYTVDPTTGAVRFVPVAAFTGATTAVPYTVADADGTTATANLVIDVVPVAPRAANDAVGTDQNTPVTFAPSANDRPGVDGGSALVPGSLRLVNGADQAVTDLQLADGRYTVNTATGAVTFTPRAGFSGTMPQVTYAISDAAGQTSRATIDVQVAAATPVANPDAQTTTQATAATLDVLANDRAGNANTPLVPGTVRLVAPAGSTLGEEGRRLTVPGQGTYLVNVENGRVTFLPLASFTGSATPVTYRVADTSGTVAESQLSVTVTAVAPRATDDARTTPQNTPVSLDPAENDRPGVDGGSAVVPNTLRFIGANGQLVESLTLTEGRFAVDTATGRVTFTPAPRFSGVVPQVRYSIADGNTQRSSAGINITVTAAVPVAADDVATTPQASPVSLEVLANDRAGNPALPLVPDTVVLSTVEGGTLSADRRRLEVAGEGVYTVNVRGVVTFTPVTAFVGTARTVPYSVSDIAGQTSSAQLTVTVVPVGPRMVADAAVTEQNTPVTFAPGADDLPGVDGGSAPILSTVRLVGAGGASVDTLTVTAGVFTVNTANGNVTFTPAAGFTGLVPQIQYRITDGNQQTGTGTIDVQVTPVSPVANDDAATTPQAQAVPVDVIANDRAGNARTPLTAGSVVLSALDGVQPTENGKRLAVAGQGVYTVGPSGVITFTPVASFTGAATPVVYTIGDADGRTDSAELSISVTAAPPRTVADAATTPQNTPVSLDPAANDLPGVDGGSAPVAATVRLLTAQNLPVTELSLPGAGVFRVSVTGTVTFTPEPGFSGSVPQVRYRISDGIGQSSTSVIDLQVVAARPVANPDAGTTRQGTVIPVDLAANDRAGNAALPLDAATVVFTAIAGGTLSDDGRSLTVDGEGVYTLVEGVATFTPEPAFVGAARAVPYSISDAASQTASSQLRITVTPVGPRTVADAAVTERNTPVTFQPGEDDLPGVDGGSAPVLTTLRLLDGDAPVTRLAVTAGVFTVDTATGDVTFRPAQGFTGEVPQVRYVITDGNRATGIGTIDVVVGSAVPSAGDDTARTRQGTPTPVTVLANDRPGNGATPLVPGSVVLTGAGGGTVSDAGKTLTVDGQGAYTVDADGVVTFTPVAPFIGATTPVQYRVSDVDGQPATALIRVTVAPVGPRMVADAAVTEQNTNVTFFPGEDDLPGVDGGSAPDLTTLRLLDGDTPVETLTLAEGTFTVDTTTGAVTFDPAPGFSGRVPEIRYRILDGNGQTGVSTIDVLVAAVIPVANDDGATTRQAQPAIIPVVGNDRAGNDATPLVPGSVVFTGADQSGGTLSDDARTLTVDGEGTYAVDGNGVVTFTPLARFTGAAAEVQYAIQDVDRQRTTAVIRVIVTAVGPRMVADAAVTEQNTNVTFFPGEDDLPGVDGGSAPDLTTLRLLDGDTPVETLTLAEGTFTVDTTTGAVTFDPAPGFSGLVPEIRYRITDGNGQTGVSTIDVTVQPAVVQVNDDRISTPQNAPVTVAVLGNDVAGNQNTPLDVTSVRLQTSDGVAPSADGLSLTFPNQGTFTVNTTTGAVVFVPVAAFTGATRAVTYSAADVDGSTGTATIVVDVAAVAPRAAADAQTTEQNTPITFPVAANDRPGVTGGAPVVPSSVRLVGAGDALVTTLAIAGRGVFTVAANGDVTFTPEEGFTGRVNQIQYSIADTNNLRSRATVDITVSVVTPTADADIARTPQGRAIALDILDNDLPGNVNTPLAPSSVVLSAPGIAGAEVSPDGRTVVVPDEGTYAYTTDGTVSDLTFTPLPAFVGAARAITYSVSDVDGSVDTATVTVTVDAVAARAIADGYSTGQNQPITFSPAANDLPGVTGGSAVVPSTLRLVGPGTTFVTELDVEGGLFTVDVGTGEVTFTPDATFSGPVPTVSYRVADGNRLTSTATIDIAVAASMPMVNDDAARSLQGEPASVNVLANDRPGNAGTPFVAATVVLREIEGGVLSEDGKTLTIDGQGTVEVAPDGTVTFTPVARFVNDATVVTYAVTDAGGNVAEGAIAFSVTPLGPRALADAASTGQNTPVTLEVLANDTPGVEGGSAIDPATVEFIGAADDGSFTTAGGNFRVDGAGVVTFAPAPGFSGNATAEYRVTDVAGATGQAVVTVRVVGVRPVANNDAETTGQGEAVRAIVLDNDRPGNAATPLDISSVQLEALPGAGPTLEGKELTVPNQGTYRVDAAGVITFTPLAAFTGDATPVPYVVFDADRQPARATLSVTVAAAAPRAVADAASTPQNTPVTLDPAANDLPGVDGGSAPVAASVRLLDGDQAVTTLDVDGGTFAVDIETGIVTFTPDLAFSGAVRPVTYRVSDANDRSSTSTLTVVVRGATPIANPDIVTTRQDQDAIIPVVANDRPGNANLPLVAGSVVFTGVGGVLSDDGRTLTVSGEGVYRVDADGIVTFDPEAGFVNAATEVEYSIRDIADQLATARIRVTVTPVGPRMVADAAVTQQNTPVTFQPGEDDLPGVDGGSPVDLSTLRLLDGTTPVDTLTVAGAGTFTVNRATGDVTFVPVAGFTGTVPEVRYQVEDGNGQVGTTSIDILVTAVTPVANPDERTTRQDETVIIPVVLNDRPGNDNTPLDPATVVFTGEGGGIVSNAGKTLTVTDQGDYTIDDDGVVTFDPQAAFVGTATPVQYSVRDVDGQTVTAQIRVTVTAVGPRLVADAAVTQQNTPVTFQPGEDDLPGVDGGSPVDLTTLQLLDGDEPVDTLRLPQGTFTVNRATGDVTFTPAAGVVGAVPEIRYQVQDGNGQVGISTIDIFVTGVTPVANLDVVSTRQDENAVIPVVANDRPGNERTPLDPATVVFTGVGGTVSDGGRTLTVDGEGVYTVDGDGVVTFDPEASFVNDATPVQYSIEDADGRTVTAEIRVTVSPVGPRMVADAAVTQQNVPVTFQPGADDLPGVDGGSPVDLTTLRLLDGDEPVDTLSLPQGTFTVNRATSDVTFDPEDGFSGSVPTVLYRVEDGNGQIGTSTISITVGSVTPVAGEDLLTTRQAVPATANLLANDVPGNGATPLDPTTVVFTGVGGGTVSNNGKTLTVSNQGVYTVDADGGLVFTPQVGFVNAASPVQYRVADVDGQTTTATIRVTVTPVGPRMVADAAVTQQNMPVTFQPGEDDRPGVDGGSDVDLGSLRLLGANDAPVTVLTLDEGVFRVNTANGDVTFTPAAGFAGPVLEVRYRVLDGNGQVGISTIDVLVTAVTPVANPDLATTRQAQAAVIDVVANDRPGNDNTPLDRTSVIFTGDGGGVVSDNGKTLTVADQGVYRINASGVVTFTPAASFVGEATAVEYEVQDADDLAVRADIRVTVTPVGPRMVADAAVTQQNTPVTFQPGADDLPGVTGGSPVDVTSVRLLNGTAPVTVLSLTDIGVFRVDATNGDVTFTPAAGFSGAVPEVRYQIEDGNGQVGVSTIDILVTGVTPTAGNDSGTVLQGEVSSIDVLANDVPGNARTPLVPEGLVLGAVDGGTLSEDGRTLAVPNQGTWRVQGSTVTFTPIASFTGVATPVTYTVQDSDGQPATATITVSVTAVAAVAVADAVTTEQNTAVTFAPAENDRAGVQGGSAPVPASVRLLDAAGAEVTELVLAAGRFTVDTDTGRVTFTPAVGFAGSVPEVRYSIRDGIGQRSVGSISLDVVSVAPVANADSRTTTQAEAVPVPVLANDLPGNEASPFDPATVTLGGPDGSGAELSEDRRTLQVPGQGTFRVDPASGTVLFTPVPAFTGTTATVTYTVRDINGTEVSSTLSVTVTPVAPRAVADAVTTQQNVGVTITSAANDLPGVTGGSTPLASSVRLVDPATGDAVDILVVTGGVFTVDTSTGSVRFEPTQGFAGAVPQVEYVITDGNGQSSRSTIDVSVDAVSPTAGNDPVEVAQGGSARITVLANDTAGNAATPLVPGSVVLTAVEGGQLSADGRTLVVPGQGTYTVDAESGVVVFDADPAFTGRATSVTYTVTDVDGTSAGASIQVEVTPVAPRAVDDVVRTGQNQQVTFDPAANDRPGVDGGTPLVPASVRLLDAAGAEVTELVLAAGTFTVDPATGSITFAPAQGFTGTVPQVTYVVTDGNGSRGTAGISLTVLLVNPVANDDSASTVQGRAVSVDVLRNDLAGNDETPFDPTTVVLNAVDGGELSAGGRQLDVPGEGTWTVAPDTGVVTFLPEPGFAGTATTVTYTVRDVDGQGVSADITVEVTAVGPRVRADAVGTAQNTPVTLDPAANDLPGIEGGSAPDRATLRFVDGDGQLVTTLTVSGGSYTVDTTTGIVTFRPTTGFIGSAATVTYSIADANGERGQATIDVAVGATAPTANDDAATTTQGASVPIEVLGNDVPVDGQTPLVPGSVTLRPLAGAELSEDRRTLVVPGQGTWTVGADGAITFQPVVLFVGATSPVTYVVLDDNGEVASAAVVVDVEGVGPRATADTTRTGQNTPVTLAPAANDLPGVEGGTPVDPASVRLLDADGGPVQELAVDGGTFTVDTATGGITFTPAPGFAGSVGTVRYVVADTGGRTATSTIDISVLAVTPLAGDDAVTTRQGVPVTVDVLGNDSAGNDTTPLDPATVVLTAPAGVEGAELSEDGKTLQVPGEGTYRVDPETGAITFTPAGSFTGTAAPVTYAVSDVDGATVSASFTVTVAAVSPLARDDSAVTEPETAVRIDVLSNDQPGSAGALLVPTSVGLLAPEGVEDAVLSADGRGLLVPGEGTYSVNAFTGEVTFTPADGFDGTTTAVGYSVADTNGTRTQARIVVVVGDAAPGLAVDKIAALEDANENGVADPGETIRYVFDVTNTGNVTLTDVAVQDPKVTGLAPESATIRRGETVRFTADPYTVTAEDIAAGAADNSATATGRTAAVPGAPAEAVQSAPDTTSTVTVEREALLTVEKTAELSGDDDIANEGEIITYSFRVRNAGNVVISGVTVDDPQVTFPDTGDLTLAPGEARTLEADPYRVTAEDVAAGSVLNTATVGGTAPTLPNGDPAPPVLSAPSTVELPAGDPELVLEKIADLDDVNGNGLADAGETIAYSFRVTNTGPVLIEDVRVEDDRVTGLDEPRGIAPRATETFEADPYVVTDEDVTVGSITNTARAFGFLDGERIGSPQDTVTTTPVPARPSVNVEKDVSAGDDGDVTDGQDVDYTVTVKNDGNVDLAEAVVEDDLTDVLDDAMLKPGTSATRGEVTVTGGQLRWTGPLAIGEEAVITYGVTVSGDSGDSGDSGNGVLRNSATAIGVVDPPVDPPAGPVDPPVDQPAPPTPAPPVTDGDVTVNPVVDAPPVVHPIPGLAVTGAQLTGIVASALGLLVAGGIALVVIRRRRAAADD
ncbi:Ig-like domain-containing protein [Arthrobacter bussei]|uniref:Tandem-95 repeat protein n=1 Tax=Arthrobacter bussei TaxID=2594179 RepID=A0A7X1NRK7_9MICC|nr:tandem-95 repeat protein [Arthrobacter bussei]MPY11599.1 tandem-95 repeat protein [Arthrobacter bussei]